MYLKIISNGGWIDFIKISVKLYHIFYYHIANIITMWWWQIFLQNAFSASLLQSLVSHDPSGVILICWFAAQETFIITVSDETVVLLTRFFQDPWWIESWTEQHLHELFTWASFLQKRLKMIRLHYLSSLPYVKKCTQLLRFTSLSTVPNANHQSPMEVSPIILIDFPCWNGNISCIGCTNLESRKSTGGFNRLLLRTVRSKWIAESWWDWSG